MAFFVRSHPAVDQHILSIAGLSDAGKATVINGYLHDLGEQADHFLEKFPTKHEAYTFEYEFSLVDGDHIYEFRFVVDGSAMNSYSIVDVLYVDHETTPIL